MASTSNVSDIIETPVEVVTEVVDKTVEASTETLTDSAQTHLDQGIRSLAMKKYSDACDSLSRATELLAEKYGDLAPEVGDALMLYGKALLMNAIAQSDVLGNGGGAAKESEENAVAGPSTSSSAAPLTAQSIQFHFGGDAEEQSDEEGEEEEGEGDETMGGDREDDLETAFLMLDSARAIYEKIDTEEAKGKLAEIHRMLGDVASESEQFESAVTEYTSSLSYLTAILPPYHRSLSEIHMLIALALDYVPDAVERAVGHAEKARDVLVAKLVQLRGIEGKTERDEREIVDIGELMGDVEMKIEDLKVVPTEAPQTDKEKALQALILNATGPNKTAGIVNNLNSLVKRKKPVAAPVEAIAEESVAEESNGKGKRKAEDQGENEEKKVKVDE